MPLGGVKFIKSVLRGYDLAAVSHWFIILIIQESEIL